MKNLFLLLITAAAISLSSCSAEDNGFSASGPGEGSIIATFDATVKNFTNTFVTQQSSGNNIVLSVTGTVTGSNPEIFSIELNKGQTGGNVISNFKYSKNGVGYPTTFTTIVSINSDNHLKGTFSGTIAGNNETITVTEGSFDIFY